MSLRIHFSSLYTDDCFTIYTQEIKIKLIEGVHRGEEELNVVHNVVF